MTEKPARISVLVVDDHHLVRSGLAALIDNEVDMLVVGQAVDGEDALAKAAALRPGIVLMDISMPGMDGIEATRRIARLEPAPRVLILSQYDHGEYVRCVVQAGAGGYILKSAVAEDLLRAIRALARGDSYFAPAIARQMADESARPADCDGHGKPEVTLTSRENEILHFIVEGHTNQQIARRLHISVRTVEFHRANITEKAGVRDTAGLVKFAILRRLVELPSS